MGQLVSMKSVWPRFVTHTNRDSYHVPRYRYLEELQSNGFQTTSRGLKRYDPESRRYQTWETAEDFEGLGTHGEGIEWFIGEGYPRFTESEMKRFSRRSSRFNPVDARKFASDWNGTGPKVCISKELRI